MTTNYPKPFLRNKIWYFRYTDRYGKRVQKSTQCQKKAEAQKIIKNIIDLLDSDFDMEITLEQLLSLYTNPLTNPRYLDAQISGASYGMRYAIKVGKEAEVFLKTLSNRKALLHQPLHKITRRTVKDMAQMIVHEHGRTAKARSMYKMVKTTFSQAADDGIIQMSPALGLPDIKVKPVKKKFALPPQDIRKIIHSDLFPSQEAKACFIILATCGLRRGEFLAMTSRQVQGDALVIDRAYKNDELTIIGPPKWGKVRTIALPEIAQESLASLFTGRKSLSLTARNLSTYMRQIGRAASKLEGMIMPECWANLTPHVLRHSLNTMLRVEGLPDVLVAEYMSWTHQDNNSVQEGYTHLYARNLRPVANAVDRLIGYGKTDLALAK